MNHKARDVRNYIFTQKDQLFLDANIWLYLHGPQPPRNYLERTYSKSFKDIKNAKNKIYIDVLIVSEFINTYARRKWKLVAPRFKYFKTFRNSQHFKVVAADITADAKRVIQHCSLIESGSESLKINDLLNEYANGDSDFNDQVITDLCKNNGFTLITNDSDFKTQEIPILTANRNLLKT